MEHITINGIVLDVSDITYIEKNIKLVDNTVTTYYPAFHIVNLSNLSFDKFNQVLNSLSEYIHFHGVQFPVVAQKSCPYKMETILVTDPNGGYPYNPDGNIIEKAIIQKVKAGEPIYGLADEIQEDIEEKQWLSQMRYLM